MLRNLALILLFWLSPYLFTNIAVALHPIKNDVLFAYKSTQHPDQESGTEKPSFIKIPVLKNGAPLIDKEEGAISFYFTMVNDAGPSQPNFAPDVKTLFKLGDGAQHFKITIYRHHNQSYLEFRHDATDNCTGAQCQRSVSTSALDPQIIQKWRPGEKHHIIVSWNFKAKNPSMDLYIDGKYAINQTKSPQTSYTRFSPEYFYIGSDTNGNTPSKGIINDLVIYKKEFLSERSKITDYIDWIKNNGIWDSNEIHSSTSDAPKPINLAGAPYGAYSTPPFTKIFEGTIPSNGFTTNISFRMLKDECETRFFNIYAGDFDLKETTIRISDLTNENKEFAIMSGEVQLRVVHNWWQASGTGITKSKIPNYTPELMIFDEISFATWEKTKKGLPDNFNINSAKAYITAHNSKQFSMQLCLDSNAQSGTYKGIITISPSGAPASLLDVRIDVLNSTLPKFVPIATIYHESRFDISGKADNYVTKGTYLIQLDNIKKHGFNGIISYGDTEDYIRYARQFSLDSFFCFASDSSIDKKVAWLTEHNLKPIFLGEDEPNLFPERIPAQIKRTDTIHSRGALVATAISKSVADQLAAKGSKLDHPILGLETTKDHDINSAYFKDLVIGKRKGNKEELIYWQATQENPLKNRFYAGYFLFLSQLGGIAPYVYQKNRGDTFDDFSNNSTNERSLNLAYPSKNGIIDTLQWDALREGLDDYRMLQMVSSHIYQTNRINPEAAKLISNRLDMLLQKYIYIDAFKHITEMQFDADREALLDMILESKHSDK